MPQNPPVTRQAEAAKPEKLGATEHLEVISAPGIEELGQTPEVSKSALLTEKVQFSVWNEEKTALLTETEDGSARPLCTARGKIWMAACCCAGTIHW